ncbi:FtsX-like permease family protein [Desulfoprunum benzoelyticum]|uniref:Cell division protein FtsX n=1 Tax=Desulfoprunum benzoelyticum TaxID=1506996 RepID=A0A840UZ44_9BACT|nr:permease-like cell division protein FtsX [Desulfoprunum benzoelyticum]MBB5346719.1 cell division transport system permease protein [Desulfoprunum benzoelyticum]MBM9529039.1 FtsX-like permease family protein [Desulfoprunum benzoelyticum]
MNFWFTVFRQVGRNLRQTWPSQLMTLLTVTLSVLIFAFFYLVYTNMLTIGDKLGDDLRLIVYLEEEPGPEMQQQLLRKITSFDEVEAIHFISRTQAYDRFSQQMSRNRDVLEDMPRDFLPASIEVVPLKTLRGLKQIKLFSEYLAKLPGTIKVQYGKDWIERFYSFTNLLSIVVFLSGSLLILTAVFMVAYTIRLTIMGRQAELELLKLVGATNNYIRTPFLLEGLVQGLLGSALGLLALYLLFDWIKDRFSGPGLFNLFEFTFLPVQTFLAIVLVSILLCTVGSFTSIQKYLRI